MDTRSTLLLGALLLTVLASSGCTTLNENECRTDDWHRVGYKDGTRGYPGDRVEQHRKACAKYGISPDFIAYQNGHASGLSDYCRPENGFRVGVGGGDYHGVCPADLEPKFVSAYDTGHHLRELRSQVAEVNSNIEAKRRELNSTEDELANSSAASTNKDSTTKLSDLGHTKKLTEKVRDLKTDIRRLERKRKGYEAELAGFLTEVRFSE
jgi:hypothetical protein